MISKHFIERVSKGPAIFYRLFFSEGGVEDLLGNTWFYGGVGGGEGISRRRVSRGDYRKLIAN